jgi:hypothetical protein
MLDPRSAIFEDQSPDCADTAVVAELDPSHRAPAQPEHAGLELPGWIWAAMALCYGLFFGGLLLGTGHDGEALFALVISIAYAAMYFGTAGVLFGLKPAPQRSSFARGTGPLQTWTGPMDTPAVAAQILTVPACLAFFGIAIATIRWAIA